MTSPIAKLLTSCRVVVCVGAGGVGKTTVSACLGVAAAKLNRKSLVLTVDPARRLANALGLHDIRQDVQTITPEALRKAGINSDVSLDVAMLDVRSTFDRVVTRLSPTSEAAEAILANRFYQQGSTALAGSQEYMAMARLSEVVRSSDYDVIILDTPPSAHALDFLEAPQRMIDLFGSSAFRTLLRTMERRGRGAGIFRRNGLVMRGLSRFTGAESFSSLLQFFVLLSATFDGFIRTAEEVMSLLRSAETSFVIVSACDEVSTVEGRYLYDRLIKEDMRVGGWILNRVMQSASATNLDLDQAIAELRELGWSPARIDAMVAARRAMADLHAYDMRHVESMAQGRPGDLSVRWLPRWPDEPSQLRELHELVGLLLTEPDRGRA